MGVPSLLTRSLTVPHPAGGTIRAETNGISFTVSETHCVQRLQLALKCGGAKRRARYGHAEAVADGLDAWAETGLAGVTVQTRVRFVPGLAALTLTHILTNGADRELPVDEIETGLLAKDSGLRIPCHNARELRFCHTDNVRTERFPYCQTEYPYVRTIPVEPRLLGVGEDQPFPAILLTEREYRHGWVFAAAAQERTFLSWRLQKGTGARPIRQFAIRHEFPQARAIVLKPGEALELDGVFIQAQEGTHPQNGYADYLNWLSARVPLRGARTPMLREGMFCSWNYGRFRSQDSRGLLATARFIASHLPRLKYFLVDAGYLSTPSAENSSLSNDFLDRFYPDPEAAVDVAKFPRGMRAFADEIRSLGLKPGIWWTPMTGLDSALGREHPDWFLEDRDGGPYRIGANGYLDLTVEPARAFVDRVLKTILQGWGMSAIKMDFWSQSVESRQARVRVPGLTALDVRRLLFDRVRAHLPPDGVFLTCVAVGMGNPFGGIHADAYRNSIDIGAGVWHEQLENCCWSLPMLGMEGRKSFLFNGDSAGINLTCPENENFFRLTWCFITMGMQEIGGKLEELPEPYAAALRKFTDRCDRGYRCLCPDERAFTGEPFPEVLYVDYPEGSPTRAAGIRQSVALFNWTDESRIVSVPRRALGHVRPVTAINFWTGASEAFHDPFICKELASRSALLYDIPDEIHGGRAGNDDARHACAG